MTDEDRIERCLAALSGAGDANLDDLRGCYRGVGPAPDPLAATEEVRLYAAYAEATGIPLRQLTAEEAEGIRDGLAKGEHVAKLERQAAAVEARAFAEREAAEEAEADRLWPTYAALLGLEA